MEAGTTVTKTAASSRRKLIAGIVACMAVSATATGVQERASMDIQPYNLWQLLEALGDQPSLAPDKIRLSLPVDFTEKKRTPYFSFYDGARLDLADQVEIEKVELRASLSDEARGLVVLSLAGTCLPIEQVRARYPELALANQPRDRSPDEETTYSVQQPWGLLSFGFNERRPQCLATVVIDRTAPPPGE